MVIVKFSFSLLLIDWLTFSWKYQLIKAGLSLSTSVHEIFPIQHSLNLSSTSDLSIHHMLFNRFCSNFHQYFLFRMVWIFGETTNPYNCSSVVTRDTHVIDFGHFAFIAIFWSSYQPSSVPTTRTFLIWTVAPRKFITLRVRGPQFMGRLIVRV